jgi:hypothetical protein
MRRALVEILRKVDIKKVDSVEIDGKDNYTFEELKKQPEFIV